MEQNKLQVTKQMIETAPSPKELISIPAVRDNWISTYEKTSGKNDGAMRFEGEMIMFLQTIAESYALGQCDKFSIYGAWIELAISGLSLRDGLSYIVPYGKKASFMVGWKGRLEQMLEMPQIVHVPEPQVVYDCDIFEYELGEKTKIHKHIREGKAERTKDSKITHVYLTIKMSHGSETYIMERLDVLNIRDRFSAGYKSYVADCKANNKQIGETFSITKNKSNNQGTYQQKIEPPMWVTDEAQAFKKTLVKRVYGGLPKLPKQKYLDSKIKVLEEKIDADEVKDMKFDEFTEIADEKTGEITKAADNVGGAVEPENTGGAPAATAAQAGQTSAPAGNNTGITDAEVISETTNLKDLASNPNEGF
jgi:recombinational DNA repair protein RecT